MSVRLMNSSRLRQVRLFKSSIPSIFAPSSLFIFPPLIQPGHQSRETLTTFSPAFRHTDRSISNPLAKGELMTCSPSRNSCAASKLFLIIFEKLYPTLGIFLYSIMDSSVSHFRSTFSTYLFLTLALIFDTESIQKYISSPRDFLTSAFFGFKSVEKLK